MGRTIIKGNLSRKIFLKGYQSILVLSVSYLSGNWQGISGRSSYSFCQRDKFVPFRVERQHSVVQGIHFNFTLMYHIIRDQLKYGCLTIKCICFHARRFSFGSPSHMILKLKEQNKPPVFHYELVVFWPAVAPFFKLNSFTVMIACSWLVPRLQMQLNHTESQALTTITIA